MGVGDGGNRVGLVVGVGKGVEAGLLVARDWGVAMSVGEGSNVGKSCGAHAMQRVRMQRKTRDFIFALKRSVFE